VDNSLVVKLVNRAGVAPSTPKPGCGKRGKQIAEPGCSGQERDVAKGVREVAGNGIFQTAAWSGRKDS
jgi:hypothetical protein